MAMCIAAKLTFSCPVLSPTPAVIITGVQFSYLSYSSFTEQCGHSIVMLLLPPQITQLKIEYNPFAKGFRGCELAGPRR